VVGFAISGVERSGSASREFNGKEGSEQEQSMGFLNREYL
jgi:hypothetical protein